MIQFPCTCGYRFDLDDDQAGGATQCPRCRRLVDVPTHAGLRELAEDGTYALHPPPARPDSDRVASELVYVYQRGTRDAVGNEIDLRLSDEEIAAVGGEPIPLDPDASPRKHAPRYDPETGELIVPLEIRREVPAPVGPGPIPLAKPTLNYASGTTAHSTSVVGTFLHLMTPANAAVMISVFFVHVLYWPLLLTAYSGIFLLVVAVPVLGGLILAHYGNVIEDVGVFDKDELPRPLRDLGFYEDIWHPFYNMVASLVICYGPAIWLPMLIAHYARVPAAGLGLMALLALAGTYLLPAVVLTMMCSGTVLNLRPDRVVRVIAACGRDYLFTFGLCVVALGFYAWGFLGTCLAVGELIRFSNLPFWLTSWSLLVPVLVVGIFLTHLLCMNIGLLNRRYYEQFPWVLQRHVSTRKPGAVPATPPPARPPLSGGGRTARKPGSTLR